LNFKQFKQEISQRRQDAKGLFA